jgi:integrase
MARISYQKGSVERRQRKHGTIYVLRYRLRQGGEWVEKTEELKDRHGVPFTSSKSCKEIPKEVRRAADVRMVEINKVNDGAPRSLTMAEFLDGLWRLHKKKLKTSTAYNYDRMAERFIIPELGNKLLHEIDSEEITLFFARREAEQLSSAYRLTIYQIVQSMFALAAAYKKVKENPVNPKLHRPTLERKEKPALAAEEIRRVIELANPEYRTLLFCIAITGLRIGETLGLQWRDVDFSRRRLSIDRTLWTNVVQPPKTEASRRALHLPSALADALQAHKATSRWDGPEDFVFSREDGAALNANSVRLYVLYPALEQAGIKRGRGTHGFHLFRHSAASIVYAEMRDLTLAQELLGHTRLSTTADIYTHTSGSAEAATETLAREIWQSCGLTVAETSTQVN